MSCRRRLGAWSYATWLSCRRRSKSRWRANNGACYWCIRSGEDWDRGAKHSNISCVLFSQEKLDGERQRDCVPYIGQR